MLSGVSALYGIASSIRSKRTRTFVQRRVVQQQPLDTRGLSLARAERRSASWVHRTIGPLGICGSVGHGRVAGLRVDASESITTCERLIQLSVHACWRESFGLSGSEWRVLRPESAVADPTQALHVELTRQGQ